MDSAQVPTNPNASFLLVFNKNFNLKNLYKFTFLLSIATKKMNEKQV